MSYAAVLFCGAAMLLSSCSQLQTAGPTESCLVITENSWAQKFIDNAEKTPYDDQSAIIGKARNSCSTVIGTAYIEFNVFNPAGAQIASTVATSRNIQPGATWSFTAPVIVGPTEAAYTFKLTKVTAVQ